MDDLDVFTSHISYEPAWGDQELAMADLRIFSYLPNPRVSKATIAARLSGATVEVIGARPPKLTEWLWDYEARPISDDEKHRLSHFERVGRRGFLNQRIYKSDSFLEHHPFGDVPAAFGRNGEVGVFESNSIMRAAARLGPNGAALYGRGDPLDASRIDGYLDKTLVFAGDVQRYLLSIPTAQDDSQLRAMADAYSVFMDAIERSLSKQPYLTGDELTLADIAFVCEICLLSNERAMAKKFKSQTDGVLDHIGDYPKTVSYLQAALQMPAFSEDLEYYRKQLFELQG